MRLWMPFDRTRVVGRVLRRVRVAPLQGRVGRFIASSYPAPCRKPSRRRGPQKAQAPIRIKHRARERKRGPDNDGPDSYDDVDEVNW
jgi:hypothetical protein